MRNTPLIRQIHRKTLRLWKLCMRRTALTLMLPSTAAKKLLCSATEHWQCLSAGMLHSRPMLTIQRQALQTTAIPSSRCCSLPMTERQNFAAVFGASAYLTTATRLRLTQRRHLSTSSATIRIR